MMIIIKDFITIMKTIILESFIEAIIIIQNYTSLLLVFIVIFLVVKHCR
jgi:hypothetical protein